MLQGNIIGYSQVVDQGQGKNGVCRASLQERFSLLKLPANARAGISQVSQQWQQVPFFFSAHFQIVLLDCSRVEVKGHGENPPLACNAAEKPDISAQVPNRRRLDLFNEP